MSPPFGPLETSKRRERSPTLGRRRAPIAADGKERKHHQPSITAAVRESPTRGVQKLDLPCKKGDSAIQLPRLTSPRRGRITPKNSEVGRRMALAFPGRELAHL